ncbi:Gliding motility-associated ABC transporter permease protein GldF [hydrothermal vent metagenome]|uniref:Gliding motility-associated ABC transporter permease protein GldF n=1 Tax=hydrothermal vent metagenome TaxID=652676 RepID=A0A3B0W5W7_9ZZZZ
MILAIAYRELRSLFLSPLAWVILAVVQIILAWSFFTSLDVFFNIQSELSTLKNAPGVTDLVISPLYEVASIILLMITPLLTMRLISEEKRNHTISLLYSAPISLTDIVLGKYLGLLFFIFVLLFLIILMPLSLQMGTELDMAKLFSGALGLFLVLASFSAAGLYMSSLTDNPMIAAISTFGLLLLLWMLNVSADSSADGTNVLSYLSLNTHFATLLRGILNTRDIAFFLLFISGFIVLTIRQLETQRLQS